VRRSRDRFWVGDDTRAFDTLYTVLETVTRVAAPFLPLVTEEVWKGLTGGRSVHLTDWPDETLFPADDALVESMDRVREIASAGLALRKSTGLRVRLPLAELTVVSERTSGLTDFADILRDELNIKKLTVRQLGQDALEEFGITKKLTVNARAVGPRLGKAVQQVIAAAKAGDWEPVADGVRVGGVDLASGEFDLELQADAHGQAITFLAGSGFVLLNTTTTPELEAEGLARDLVRAIQDARKAAGLDVSDRIVTNVVADMDSVAAIKAHRALIQRETLSTRLGVDTAEPLPTTPPTAVGRNGTAWIEVQKA
jgi:Isoleucyl-tRNA synthetase